MTSILQALRNSRNRKVIVKKLSKLKRKPDGWAFTSYYNDAIDDAISVVRSTFNTPDLPD